MIDCNANSLVTGIEGLKMLWMIQCIKFYTLCKEILVNDHPLSVSHTQKKLKKII